MRASIQHRMDNNNDKEFQTRERVQALMKTILLVFVLACLFLSFTTETVISADTKNFQVKKQPEIQQIKPKKPVKIKLKRSAEGKYSWDLSGDDVDEVVRIDKRLKKLLNIE
jgi:hypothetical protein